MSEALDMLNSLETVGELCTPETGEESFPLEDVVEAILKLSCVLCEKKLYPYQMEFIRRIITAVLEHSGEMLTGLWSRQSGKTEAISAVCTALMAILPQLAKDFPKDWRLNITDEQGRYRGYKNGIDIGIYAPILDQSDIMHQRIRDAFETPSAQQILDELGIAFSCNRGCIVKLTNGSTALAMSASVNSKIEGHTHHLVIAEEAQDIDAMKIRKSIHPMIASTKGTIVKIGTANTVKGDFYQAIKHNKRVEIQTGRRNHFFFPYRVCVQHNSLYRDYIKEEMGRIGTESDEFKMSYGCEWLLERGMFVTDKVLMTTGVPCVNGKFSIIHESYTGQNLVVGIDLGKETDSTVVTVMDVDWAEPADVKTITRNFQETDFVAYNKHIVSWLELQGDDYESQYYEICEWLEGFHPIRKIVLDATREQSFSDRIAHTEQFREAEVEDFVFSTQSKAIGYRLLHGDLIARRFTFPAGDDARRDPRYRYFVTQMLDLIKDYHGGYLVVSHPDETGAHDDYPDSAMLANYGANEPTADLAVEQFTGNAFA